MIPNEYRQYVRYSDVLCKVESLIIGLGFYLDLSPFYITLYKLGPKKKCIPIKQYQDPYDMGLVLMLAYLEGIYYGKNKIPDYNLPKSISIPKYLKK